MRRVVPRMISLPDGNGKTEGSPSVIDRLRSTGKILSLVR